MKPHRGNGDWMHIRIPRDVADKLIDIASVNRRSTNGEAVYAIERHLAAQDAEAETPAGAPSMSADDRQDWYQACQVLASVTKKLEASDRDSLEALGARSYIREHFDELNEMSLDKLEQQHS